MVAKAKQRLDVQIRWLIRRDLEEVTAIERQVTDLPWNEEDFLCALRQRNCIGMVAEVDNTIVGYMVYELHKSRLHILNFAVDPEYQRREVGKQMVDRLINKLTQQNRLEIQLEIVETNLEGQLFFKAMGFRAVSVLREHHEETGEDVYVMKYRVNHEDDAPQYKGKNRIKDY